MARKDVPPPGQGKRSQKKTWREKADKAIAVYNLTADETPESLATEEATSQALPYWDDEVPQPQSQQHTFTREEAQELIEMAYQDGWQQGMEEGYNLGRNKGYKEHKIQEEEEEVKKIENQASKATTTYQDIQNTPRIVTRVDESPKTDSEAPEAHTSAKATHTVTTAPIFIPDATRGQQPFLEASRNTMSSSLSTFSSTNLQNIENDNSATYNSSTSSNNTQNANLVTVKPSDDLSISYVVHSNLQITPRSSRSDQEKNRPPDNQVPEHTTTDTRNEGDAPLLVDVEVQGPSAVVEMGPDTETIPPATSYTSYLPPRLPPLPNLQPLNPAPYNRASTPLEMSHTLTEPKSDPILPKKPTAAHQTGQFRSPGTTCPNSFNIPLLFSEHPLTTNYDSIQLRTTPTTNINPQIIDSDIPTLVPQLLATSGNIPPSFPPVSAYQHFTSSEIPPTIVIHAQTVVIGGPASTHASTRNTFNNERTTSTKGSTNSEDVHRVPVPPTTPAMPPRDLSALRSNFRHRPFSSLRRRSHRRQSTSARGHNWNTNHHPEDWSQALQVLGWIPPIH